jgi:hypothetical protein
VSGCACSGAVPWAAACAHPAAPGMGGNAHWPHLDRALRTFGRKCLQSARNLWSGEVSRQAVHGFGKA